MVIFTIVFPSILYFYVAKSRRIACWGIPNICKFENLITFDSTMTISQPLFTVGDIVQVDNRENAYITNIRGENGDLFFNVRFIVDKTEQKNVVQARCRVVPIHETTANNSRPRVNRHFSAPTVSISVPPTLPPTWRRPSKASLQTPNGRSRL